MLIKGPRVIYGIHNAYLADTTAACIVFNLIQ